MRSLPTLALGGLLALASASVLAQTTPPSSPGQPGAQSPMPGMQQSGGEPSAGAQTSQQGGMMGGCPMMQRSAQMGTTMQQMQQQMAQIMGMMQQMQERMNRPGSGPSR